MLDLLLQLAQDDHRWPWAARVTGGLLVVGALVLIAAGSFIDRC